MYAKALALWLQVADLLLEHGANADYINPETEWTPLLAAADCVINPVTLAACFQ